MAPAAALEGIAGGREIRAAGLWSGVSIATAALLLVLMRAPDSGPCSDAPGLLVVCPPAVASRAVNDDHSPHHASDVSPVPDSLVGQRPLPLVLRPLGIPSRAAVGIPTASITAPPAAA